MQRSRILFIPYLLFKTLLDLGLDGCRMLRDGLKSFFKDLEYRGQVHERLYTKRYITFYMTYFMDANLLRRTNSLRNKLNKKQMLSVLKMQRDAEIEIRNKNKHWWDVIGHPINAYFYH
ncbi:hypothetical protein Tcan_00948, partial [Toxocara canis]